MPASIIQSKTGIPEIVRLAVMLYIRFPLSLRKVEDAPNRFIRAAIRAQLGSHTVEVAG